MGRMGSKTLTLEGLLCKLVYIQNFILGLAKCRDINLAKGESLDRFEQFFK